MDVAPLLLELYGRIPPLAHDAVDGLDTAQLSTPPSGGVNTVAWLVWHVARVQDHHVAELLSSEQVYVRGGWPERFGLAADASDTGYGHTAEQVAAVRADAATLIDYLADVDARTRTMLAGLSAADLDVIVDRRWDPPVTMGVRLVSVADDALQHLGQAALVRGLLRG